MSLFTASTRAAHLGYGLKSLPGATGDAQIGAVILATGLTVDAATKLAFYLWLLSVGKVDPYGP